MIGLIYASAAIPGQCFECGNALLVFRIVAIEAESAGRIQELHQTCQQRSYVILLQPTPLTPGVLIEVHLARHRGVTER